MHEQRAPAAAACPASLSRLCSFNRAPELPHPSPSLLALSRSRSGRARARPPWTPPPSSAVTAFPLLHASPLLVRTNSSFALTSCISCSCSPWPSVVGAPPPPDWATGSRHRAWPCRHKPPRAELDRPAGVRGPPGSPPPFLRRRRAFSGRNQRAPAHPLLQNPVKDYVQQFNIREGPFCEAMTHLNSAPKDLFAVV